MENQISYSIACRLASDTSNHNKIRCNNAIDVLINNFNNAIKLHHEELLSQGLWKVSEGYSMKCYPNELKEFADEYLDFFAMVTTVYDVCDDPKVVKGLNHSDAFMSTLKEIADWGDEVREKFKKWLMLLIEQFNKFSRIQNDIEDGERYYEKLEKSLANVTFEIDELDIQDVNNNLQQNNDDEVEDYKDFKEKLNNALFMCYDEDKKLDNLREIKNGYIIPTIYPMIEVKRGYFFPTSSIYSGEKVTPFEDIVVCNLSSNHYELRANGQRNVDLGSLDFLDKVHNYTCDECGVKNTDDFEFFQPLYKVDVNQMNKYLDNLLLEDFKLPLKHRKCGIPSLRIDPKHKSCPEAIKFGLLTSKMISIEQVIFLYCHINEQRPIKFHVPKKMQETLDQIKSSPNFDPDKYLDECLKAHHNCYKRYWNFIKRGGDVDMGSLISQFRNSAKSKEAKDALDKYLEVKKHRDVIDDECRILNALLGVVVEFNSMPNVPEEFLLRLHPRLSNKTFWTNQFTFDDGNKQNGKSKSYKYDYFCVAGRPTCDFATASNPENLYKNYNHQFYNGERLFKYEQRDITRPQRSDMMKELNVFSVGYIKKRGKHEKTSTYIEFGRDNIKDTDNITPQFIKDFDASSDLSASIPNLVMMWRYYVEDEDTVNGIDLKAFAESDKYEDFHTKTANATGVERDTIKIASMKGIFNSQKTDKDFDLYVRNMIRYLLKEDADGNLTFDKSDGLHKKWKKELDEMAVRGLLDKKTYRIKDLEEFRNADLTDFGALGKWMKDQIRGLRATRKMYSVESLGYGKPFLIEGIVVIKSVIDTIKKFEFVESCGMKYDAVSFTYNRQVTTTEVLEVLDWWQKRCKKYLRGVVENIAYHRDEIIPILDD